MPAIIDSAPDCVQHGLGAKPADDTADFIVNAPYEECTGFMTFGPGTVYGESGADTAYYILTWLGITVMVIVFIAWVLYENRRLLAYAANRVRNR